MFPTFHFPSLHPTFRTFWIGDLQYWMDEKYLYTCFGNTDNMTSVKVIRNQQSQLEGYDFNTRTNAQRVLQTYNETIIPNGGQSWDTFSAGERSFRQDEGPGRTIFMGDLVVDVSDYLLQETFRARFNSVKGPKVVIYRLTRRSKGYGFVRFADEGEQMRAMTEMQ
ncbi:hypothetical protein RYX36_030863, partial [Vicia faba]